MSSKSTSDDRGGVAFLFLIGFLLLILLFVPLMTAFVAFYFARPYLGKKESWAMLLVGVGGFVFLKDYTVLEYVEWIQHIGNAIFADTAWSVVLKEFPWMGSLLLSLTFTGVLNLLGNTRVGQTFDRVIPDRPTGKRTYKPSVKRSGHYDEDLLDAERRQELMQRAAVVAPPGDLLIDEDAHSVFNTEVGKRHFPIGRDEHGNPITLTEKEIGTHGVILGSTGSGKTETIKAIAGGLLDLGWTGTILDLKEDTAEGGLRDWCVQYSNHHSIPYQELHLSDADSQTWFNSLHGMGPDEMRDSILMSQHFEAAYYEALNKELLGQLVNLMYWAHEADPEKFEYPTMYNVARICSSGPRMKERTRKMMATVLGTMPWLSKDDFGVINSPSKAQEDAAVGFGSRLGNVFDTQAGRAVLRNNPEGTRQELDITKDGLTYVGLDSLGKADLTRVMSSAMLQRMSVYASQRTTGAASKSKPRFIIVDEANWVNREIVKNLLSRARSAGIALILATQGPRDWIDQQGEDWDTLGQNLNLAIIMKQGAPDSAHLCAEYLGQVKKERRAHKFDEEEGLLGSRRVRTDEGRHLSSWTVSEELDYRVPPDTLRELRVGEAFVRVGSPDFRVDFTQVAMRDPKASPSRAAPQPGLLPFQ